MIFKFTSNPETNSGIVMSEQRRSCRLSDILARAMRGAPLDIDIDDSLPGASQEELDDWYVEPQFDDLNDAFEAGETLAANSEPVFEDRESQSSRTSSRSAGALTDDTMTENAANE